MRQTERHTASWAAHTALCPAAGTGQNMEESGMEQWHDVQSSSRILIAMQLSKCCHLTAAEQTLVAHLKAKEDQPEQQHLSEL